MVHFLILAGGKGGKSKFKEIPSPQAVSRGEKNLTDKISP